MGMGPPHVHRGAGRRRDGVRGSHRAGRGTTEGGGVASRGQGDRTVATLARAYAARFFVVPRGPQPVGRRGRSALKGTQGLWTLSIT